MIDLRTGTPGACKTLSAVEALSKMQARWEKHPDEARPVFVHGVRDLKLPHSPVPVKTVTMGGKPCEVPDWDAMPDGSYVLVDEAQSFFPPRSSQSTPPEHVAWLNTHRHRGFDITVITQHPKLIDGALRALVGKHQHFRRLFGGRRSICYEWDACSDNLGGLANAVTSYYPFPKRAFEWYKSAEVHTKQSYKLPKWLVIPFVGVAIGAFTVPRAFSTLSNGISGKGLSGQVAVAPTPAAIAGTGGALAPTAPRDSAPASPVDAVKAVIAPAAIAGCIAMAERCECVDTNGRVAKVEHAQCVQDASRAGLGIAYAMKAERGATARAEAVPMLRDAGPIPSAISLGGDPRAHIRP